MDNFKKSFPYEPCKSCVNTYGVTRKCKHCDGDSEYDQLFNADPNCVHEVVSCISGGVRCRKCNGWFCF